MFEINPFTCKFPLTLYKNGAYLILLSLWFLFPRASTYPLIERLLHFPRYLATGSVCGEGVEIF